MTYDAVGNRTVVENSYDGVETSTYDAARRLTSRKLSTPVDGAPNATLREDFTYDAAGRRVSDARYDDLSASTLIARTTTTYDALGRILGLETRDASNTLVADFDYAYDAAGRLTSKNDDGALTTYSYDNTNQLTGEDAASDDRTYSYDANGNRTMSGYSHGSDNRLTTDGTWNYTYNDEGAMIEKERISDGLTWFYAYNHRNQLTKLEQSDNGTDIDLRIEYKYDAWGNRIARSIDRDADGAMNPEVMLFALDAWNPAKPSPIGTENVDVWADLEIDGTLSTRYLRSDRVDELLARIDDLSGDPTKYWYVADHLGSTRKLLDANADVANALTYDGYGNILTETDASVRGRYAWTAREVDVEADLQYNRARVYDATIGRWMSKDPLRFAAGDNNLYRYVQNRPIDRADYSGLLLIAIDGTGSRQWLEPTQPPAEKKDETKTGAVETLQTGKNAKGRWLSHVRNFHDDYRGGAYYLHGPDSRLPGSAAGEVDAIVNEAVDFISRFYLCADEPLDLVGHSRGGYAAIKVAYRLRDGITLKDKDGNAVFKANIPVRFLGGYEPVSNVTTILGGVPANPQAIKVPDNVAVYYGIYGAPTEGDYVRSWDKVFQRVDYGPSDASKTEYTASYVRATHSAIGGAPWAGEESPAPKGHSEKNDIYWSEIVDQWMRSRASQAGVPI